MMLYARLDICFVDRIVSRYQSNSWLESLSDVKHILQVS